MNDSSNLKNNNTVLKCKITVTKVAGGFSAQYDPEIIPVYSNNTDLHFHIDQKTSDDVEIDAVSISPADQSQLIDQQISSNRQQFKLKDLNTAKGSFVLSFQFRDKHGTKLNLSRALEDSHAVSADVPKIENNPPG